MFKSIRFYCNISKSSGVEEALQKISKPKKITKPKGTTCIVSYYVFHSLC